MNSNSFILSSTIFAVIIMAIAVYCYKNPFYNWDTLPYMTVVLEADGLSPEEAHQEACKIAEQEIPAHHFKIFVYPSHEQRARFYSDADYFLSYVTFFKIKPLYTLAAAAAYELGFSLTKSLLVPSILGYLGMVVLLFIWQRHYLTAWVNLLVNVCIALFAPLLESASLATPDAFSAFLILLAFYFILKRPSFYLMLTCMFLAVLTRLDNIILATIVLSAFTIQQKYKVRVGKGALALVLTGLIVYYFAIAHYADYQRSFQAFYGQMAGKLNVKQFAGQLMSGFRTFQFSSLTIVLGLSILAMFYSSNLKITGFDRYQYCLLTLLLFIVIKFLVFPDVSSRHYLDVFALCPVLVAGALNIKKDQGIIS